MSRVSRILWLFSKAMGFHELLVQCLSHAQTFTYLLRCAGWVLSQIETRLSHLSPKSLIAAELNELSVALNALVASMDDAIKFQLSSDSASSKQRPRRRSAKKKKASAPAFTVPHGMARCVERVARLLNNLLERAATMPFSPQQQRQLVSVERGNADILIDAVTFETDADVVEALPDDELFASWKSNPK